MSSDPFLGTANYGDVEIVANSAYTVILDPSQQSVAAGRLDGFLRISESLLKCRRLLVLAREHWSQFGIYHDYSKDSVQRRFKRPYWLVRADGTTY